MRLSTAPDRDDERGLAVVCAAIDAGVTLIDTADAYCRDADDVGHNERLVARARAARPGAAITVVTKGGLTRPGGAWVPDGRARHLAEAARASRDRLGGAPLDLYLLHAIDPRVPFATSVRALARLVDDGVARRVGVSNVDRTRLEQALELAPISAVSVELSPWNTTALAGGVVALCAERGIPLLAHRPFGGPAGAARLARHPEIGPLATELGLSPAAATIVWLRSLAPVVIPLPGLTRIRDGLNSLNPPDIAPRSASAMLPGDGVNSVNPAGHTGDVVLIVGPPGAGKSTLAADLVARGYHRLNRDEQGGKLAKLAVMLDGALAGGERHVVLDNTYPTRAMRAPVIEAARRHGVAVRCVVLETSNEDAQVNAINRLLDRYGHLPGPDELAALGKKDPAAFHPGAQFRWRRQLEPPRTDEGFTAIEARPFARRASPGTRRALIVDLDDQVWDGRPASPDAITVRDGAAAALTAWRAAGWLVLATSWLPDVDAAPLLAAIRDRVPAITDAIACVHPAGPPVCWCRKPVPGMGLVLAGAHALDLTASIHVGRGPADRTFAARLGMTFVDGSAGLPPP
jgi:aryl-alcohol dehydrogenase-like predicted oxidoreductase